MSTKREKNKYGRPNIPSETVLKLWAVTAGRCEFLGCNKPLWRDDLTWKEANFSHIAHIISYSPSGPRGDKIQSKKLEKEFSNLMLVCLKHHKLIDSKKYVDKYPAELLKSYKEQHEKRIGIQTSKQKDMVTTVLIFKANIGDRKVHIAFDEACEAIEPKFPSDGKPIDLDFTGFSGDGSKNYWMTLQQEIMGKVKLNLDSGNRPNHLSIFALGPIPLLVQLGRSVGNTISADIYQHHRHTEDWKWKTNNQSSKFKYIVKRRQINSRSKKIALMLSLSGKVHLSEVKDLLHKNIPLYEVTIKKPSTSFLKSKAQLLQFQRTYRDLLTEIRTRHGSNCEVHLFPAVPAPIAVVCGRELLPKIDPPLFVYDNNKEKGGFKYTLTIN
ncbi:MAG: SAVED domain-containing protein [candidate division Zixibacteria bacterium]|nr:SAVED domain-containing protein [candidate division Zixibacteria bacterium]